MIVGLVLISAALLVLAALGVPYLLQRLNDGGPVSYTVGDCVVQNGNEARTVECSEPDAFLITSQVDRQDQCEDPTQPAIEVAGPPVRFFCLAPAVGGPTE